MRRSFFPNSFLSSLLSAGLGTMKAQEKEPFYVLTYFWIMVLQRAEQARKNLREKGVHAKHTKEFNVGMLTSRVALAKE